MTHRHWLLFFALVWLHGCGASGPDLVRMSAAASTREPLEALAADFEKRHGITVALNFGPTSTLARQIEQGGAADLFLAADQEWIDYLTTKDLLAEARPLLGNRLVVVVPADSRLSIKSLEDLHKVEVRRLALAEASVPAGRYARAALRRAGILDRIESRILDAADVRAALAYVGRGEADAGIVYATDVSGNGDCRVAFAIDPGSHPPIGYALAVVRKSADKPSARAFLDYLLSTHAADVFRHAGFTILDEKP